MAGKRKRRTVRKKSKKIIPRLVICPRKIVNKKRKISRRGKISPWLKGALAAVAPSVLAIGYGGIKKLLKKNTGYTDIY